MTAVYRDKHRCWHAAVLAQHRGQVCGRGGAGQSGEVRELQPAQLRPRRWHRICMHSSLFWKPELSDDALR